MNPILIGRMSKVRYGRSKKNKRLFLINKTALKETYSISIMLSTQYDVPYFMTGRENTNNQYDFLEFIIQALESGYLSSGNVLVFDNASVDGAEDTMLLLHDLLESAGVRIVRLPTYSPGKDFSFIELC